MSTPFTKYQKLRAVVLPQVDMAPAVQAVLNAKRALIAEQEKTAEVREAATALEQLRKANHFADLIYDVMESKRERKP